MADPEDATEQTGEASGSAAGADAAGADRPASDADETADDGEPTESGSDGSGTEEAGAAGSGAGGSETGVSGGERSGAGAADDASTAGADPEAGQSSGADAGGGPTREELRRRVEEEYDFEEFGPADMRRMSSEEWEAAFDEDAWITGEELLDRVEADLRSRVATRDVFAVVERIGGDRPRLVAYSDEGYAVVEGDGSVEGRGTVLRDVKPTVALASMPEYEVPDPPADAGLPAPAEVPENDGELGNVMLQVIGLALLLGGLVLFGAAVVGDLGGGALVAIAAGVVFLLLGGVLFLAVVNARLSGRFRAEEYRERLRKAGVDDGDRPEFLPIDDSEFDD